MTVLDIVSGICPRSMRTRTVSSRADLGNDQLECKDFGVPIRSFLLNIFLSRFICDGLGKNLC